MKRVSVVFFISFFILTFKSGAEIKSQPEQSAYFIEISIAKCRMYVYKKQPGGTRSFFREYSVATVKRGEKKYPLGLGHITGVELDPYWQPTERTKKFFLESHGIELPDIIPPGDKLNFMGSFKACLSYDVPDRGKVYRIHGNNDESKIGKRATGGCIRMKNKEGLELIKTGVLKTGTEVEITM